VIRHAATAGTLAATVGLLPIAVVEAALGTALVPPIGRAQLPPALGAATGLAAIGLAAVTPPADPKRRAAAFRPATSQK
jgi:hypothetical protein